MPLNNNEVSELIDKLDGLIPKSDCHVLFQQYGGGPDESRIVANRNGYLRVGIELMKAGIKQHESLNENGIENIDVDIKPFIDTDSEINFDWFERTDSWPVTKSPTRTKALDKLMGLTIMILLASGVLLAMVGLVTTIQFLTRSSH